MKKNIIFLIISTCCFELSGSIKCFIKVGFGDCVNCYNMLSILDDFDKVYVFKNEYKGIEKEILKEYFGIEGDVDIRTSDSLYKLFGYENLTVLAFEKDNVQIMKFPMLDLEKWLPSIKKLNLDLRQVNEPVNLENFWHDQCQIKLNDTSEIVILDPLLGKLTKLDKKGNLLHKFSSNNKFIEEVFNAKFGKNNTILSTFFKIRKTLGNKSVPVHFNTISLNRNEVYLLVTGRYFVLDSKDTILTSFCSVVKFNDKFEYKIINVESEIKPDYFYGQSYFQILNDSIVLFDVISANPLKNKYIIAENKILNSSIEFIRFYDDTIPNKLVDKRLNYRVTSFTQDNGYVAYFMFNRIFKNSKALPNLKLFDSYKFGMEFPNPKNYITGIKKVDDLLYVSYKLDTIHHASIYNLRAYNFTPPILSVPENNLKTFLQYDCRGAIYYVDKERKLIKIQL